MVAEVPGVGLQEAIESIRADLAAARESGENADVRLPVQSVTVQLQVVATEEAGVKAGFKVPFVNLEAGGSGSVSSAQTSTVTVVLGEPVDRAGRPIKVARGVINFEGLAMATGDESPPRERLLEVVAGSARWQPAVWLGMHRGRRQRPQAAHVCR